MDGLAAVRWPSPISAGQHTAAVAARSEQQMASSPKSSLKSRANRRKAKRAAKERNRRARANR